ncbi:hypothetical protein [Pseudomonas syringae group genomosp. 3]|uniref:hypothetical protein n=1 Tax=Pseudomonas syringae group genomosp. 3 TaxID=251701 RepID=UPI0011C42682|nr:hypothetical protein [Pseudomonas syringae group genomosp. 3]
MRFSKPNRLEVLATDPNSDPRISSPQSVGVRDPLKKPIFWKETGLERLYLLALIFEEEAFSDLP